MKYIFRNTLELLATLIGLGLSPHLALAQISSDSSTGTVVNQNGNQFNINGGTFSGDGKNLFHSFQEFGLSPEQIANFLSNPNITNILSRVTGGNVSVIEGLIQVTGGNSNLFLMNPAGIIFGNGAALNVPADFTATTATGIQFNGGWFNAIGSNNYNTLVGNPTGFQFSDTQPGTIINAGNLTLNPGQQLALMAGTVINVGTLETQGGNIQVVATEKGTVRISQEGQILGIEVPAPTDNQGNILPFTVADVPSLLTGNPVNGLQVNPAGEVQLSQTGTTIPTSAGTTIISGNINTSNLGANALGGVVEITGDRVGLITANVNASGTNGGGTVLIGGDFQGKGNLPNAERTYISFDSVINANAIERGNGGQVIVWADNLTGFYGRINARGGQNFGDGGFVEVSGKEHLAFNGIVDVSAINGKAGTLLLDPENIFISNSPSFPTSPTSVDAALPQILVDDFPQQDIIINAEILGSQQGEVILQATNSIIIESGTELTFVPSENNITFNANANNDSFGSFSMSPGTLINTNGRNLTITGDNIFLEDINIGSGTLNLEADNFINLIGTLTSNNGVLNIQTITAGANIYVYDPSINPEPIVPSITLLIPLNQDSQIVNVSGDLSALTIGDVNQTGNLTIAHPTTFVDPAILQANNIIVDGQITGLDNGSITINGPGNTTFLNASILTSGTPITINDSVLLGNNIDLDTTAQNSPGANITVTGTINSQADTSGINFGLRLLSGQGDIVLGDSVGNSNPLNNLQVNPLTPVATNGILTINGTVVTTLGQQLYNSPVAIGQNTVLTGSPIIFNSTLDSVSGENNNLTLNVGSNDITLNQVGTNQALGDLTINSAGATNLEGEINTNSITTDAAGTTNINTPSITTTGNQTYNDSVTIGNNTTLTADSINFNNDVNINAENLNLIADNQINFPSLEQGQVNSNIPSNLTLQNRTPNRGIIIGSSTAENVLRINNLEQIRGVNFNNLIIGRQDITSSLTVTEPVTFYVPTTLQAANINIDGTVTGLDNASITLEGSGNTTILNADILTAGNPIFIRDNVLLETDITLDTTLQEQPGAEITINGTVNSLSNPRNFTLNAGNDNIIITGAIGNNNPLNNLTANASQIQLNGGSVITAGNQTYNGNILVNQDTIFDSNGTFQSGSIQGSGQNMTIEAPTSITTGAIDTSNSSGDGGNVTLNSEGNITVSTINAQGGNEGIGGTVDITTNQFFRATGTFIDQNGQIASISTAGGLDGGAITIRHGGRGEIPFIVGDASLNGSAGVITSGTFTIDQGSFLFTERRGNVAIISVDAPPEVIPPEVTPPEVTPPEVTPPEVTPPEVIPPERERKDSFIPEIFQPQQPESIQLATTLSPTITIGTITETREILRYIEEQTAQIPALIYVRFVPPAIAPGQFTDEDFAREESNLTTEYENFLNPPQRKGDAVLSIIPEDDYELELVLITKEGEPYPVRPGITRKEVLETAENFYIELSNLGSDYKLDAIQLYDWLLKDLETELGIREIDTVLFFMPSGLRLVPIAALYDQVNEQFVVEKNYTVGLAPSINLVDYRYQDIKDSPVLAFGASQFSESQEQTPLPAVTVELPLIAGQIRRGEYLLNDQFTLGNVQSRRRTNPYPIVHLATHADFDVDNPIQSYIQLYDQKLRLSDWRDLNLKNPTVDLLVISACRTAVGNPLLELGFGGLAVQAGVKTAIASLWYVGDTGTLALMDQLYHQLNEAPIKAIALQQAQQTLLSGEVRQEGDQLITPQGNITLPADIAVTESDLSHPYYWSSFTLIGSPW